MRLKKGFYHRDVLRIAPELLGKVLARRYDDGYVTRFVITEVEAYRGEEDLACHASKGRTKRTEVMYHSGGKVYVYFVYGMHWLINVVTGKEGEPQAVLIRSVVEYANGRHYKGPGRVGKILKLDRSFYGEDLLKSKRIWIEESSDTKKPKYLKTKRIGVSYAKEWAEKEWRFVIQ